jgi:hypothetical protein
MDLEGCAGRDGLFPSFYIDRGRPLGSLRGTKPSQLSSGKTVANSGLGCLHALRRLFMRLPLQLLQSPFWDGVVGASALSLKKKPGRSGRVCDGWISRSVMGSGRDGNAVISQVRLKELEEAVGGASAGTFQL